MKSYDDPNFLTNRSLIKRSDSAGKSLVSLSCRRQLGWEVKTINVNINDFFFDGLSNLLMTHSNGSCCGHGRAN